MSGTKGGNKKLKSIPTILNAKESTAYLIGTCSVLITLVAASKLGEGGKWEVIESP